MILGLRQVGKKDLITVRQGFVRGRFQLDYVATPPAAIGRDDGHGAGALGAGGRALEWTFQSMADGGTVVLVEDITERRNAEARINHLARFDELHKLGFPLLAGVSRKSFIGRTLATNGSDAPPQERLYGSLAAMTAAILKGAHIVRVHDVKPAV